MSISKTEELANRAASRAEYSEVDTPFGKTPMWFYPATVKKLGSILFVHGLRGTHEGVEPIVGGLEEFDCYVPELPGFGEAAPLSSVHNLDNYSVWLTSLTKALNLSGDVTYFGHSFGTLLLGKHVLATGDKTRIVMLNPVSAWPMRGPRQLMAYVSLVWYRFAARIPEKAGRWMLGHPLVIWLVTEFLYKGNDPVLKAWIHTQHKLYFSKFANTKMAEEAFDASIAENLSEMAQKITQPVLLLCGDKDDITKIEAQRLAAALYDDATYVEMIGTGHLPHYERVEVVAQHTIEFIKLHQ